MAPFLPEQIKGFYGSSVLKDLLLNAHLFDPELVGNGIRDNYPESLFFETFEQYPLWLELNYRLLKEISSRYDGDIIAPMTLLKAESYEGIIQRLRDDGLDVCYVFLDADAETLRQRMVESGREKPDSWCVRQIPACLKAQQEDRFAVHVDTVGKAPVDVAREIVAVGRNTGDGSLCYRSASRT